jgi:molybdopterin converting factor small subunit
MRVSVALYGAARVVIGQPLVELSFDAPSVTLAQVLEKMIADYPRARPYLLDDVGQLPSYIRVLINNARPDSDATPAMVLHDDDHVTLMVAVAGGADPCGRPVGLIFNSPTESFRREYIS